MFHTLSLTSQPGGGGEILSIFLPTVSGIARILTIRERESEFMCACIGATLTFGRENSARRGTGSEKKLAQVLVLALVCAVVVAFGLLGTDIFQGSFPGETRQESRGSLRFFGRIRGSVPPPREPRNSCVDREESVFCSSESLVEGLVW